MRKKTFILRKLKQLLVHACWWNEYALNSPYEIKLLQIKIYILTLHILHKNKYASNKKNYF